MTKRMLALAAVLVVVGAALVGTVVWATEMDQTKSGPAAVEMQIQDPVFKKYKNGPAHFTHKAHYTDHKITCDNCHHVYKDGKNTWKEGDKVEKCSACHTEAKKNVKVDGVKVLSLYNAFHKNCKDCHRDYKKKNKGSEAPTGCKDCHPKK
jgi:hypothetical protein